MLSVGYRTIAVDNPRIINPVPTDILCRRTSTCETIRPTSRPPIHRGDTVQEVIFNQEMTETVSGIRLEEAKDMAMDAFDTSVVADEVREAVLGRYYRLEGPVLGRYLFVNEVEPVTEPGDPTDLLIKARAI